MVQCHPVFIYYSTITFDGAPSEEKIYASQRTRRSSAEYKLNSLHFE